jgi:UDP-N-acetylglucosamine 1-carboxyvinyltransferase
MDKFVIQGGNPLKGAVTVSGAKNAALPMMAASIMTGEDVVLRNVPCLRDIDTMVEILEYLGAAVSRESGTLRINARNISRNEAPYDLVRKMRASICLLGPLLGRFKSARISMPGGCVIGPRPVDLHIKGIQRLGVKVTISHGYIEAEGRITGADDIFLGGRFGSSVTATANVMMAACMAEGVTYIESAAQEPEIVSLAQMLVSMGAEIEGAGSHILRIKGVEKLHGCDIEVISDRIEAGTFLMAAAATAGDVVVEKIEPKHLRAVIDKLQETGIKMTVYKDAIKITAPSKLKSVDVITLPFPGFPTDLQAQMMALMAVADGISVITEKIYPERFMHISELNRMGADIKLEGSTSIVKGVPALSGANVMASDLRASAGLVIAGLRAEGQTEIYRVYHIDRGYDEIEKRLSALGAKIQREKDTADLA